MITKMPSFASRVFNENSLHKLPESDNDFSEEESYIPPSEGEETSSDGSELSDEEDAAGDGNYGDAPPRGSSWRLYTQGLPDFAGVLFTVNNPGAQVSTSNLP